MSHGPGDRPRNRILASLPAEEMRVLRPRLELHQLEFKQVLFDVDVPIAHVHFPERCVASVLSVMADGSAVETATIGWEGMVGLPVFLGTDRTNAHGLVQVPGTGWRMSAHDFREAIARSPGLTMALNRYTQALFTLVAQSSACNRMHAMRERCARWLLHTHDRVGGDEFPLTHQFLSQMLGVRRATVTEAMGEIQRTGAIEYVQGRVQVRNRPRLEAAACECYAIIAREFDRLLGDRTTKGGPPGDPLAGVETARDGRSVVDVGPPHRNPDDR